MHRFFMSRVEMCCKKITLYVLCVFSFATAGCSKTETVQTVDWYKAHAAAREEVIKACENNPGALAATPNCINANRAHALVTVPKIVNLPLKPLPPEFFKQYN